MNLKSYEVCPLVSIVVLNYNAKGFLKKCLDSVLDTDYANFEIIFVDNKSTDGSIDYVKQMFSNNTRLKIIALDRNHGFTEGNNIGVNYVNKDTKYIVFLNPDTEVDRNWLRELVEVMESDPTIGIAQSLILEYDRRNFIQCAGIYMIDFCGWTWALFKGLSYDQFVNNCSGLIEIFAALGASMVIRYTLFNQVRSFDPKFFMYSDEADLAWRVWLRGYKVVLAQRSIVYHALGGSTKLPEKFKTVFIERHRNKNVIRMLLKNYNLKHLLLYLPIALTLMYARALYYVIKKDVVPFMGFIRAIIWNVLNLRDTLYQRLYVQRVIRRIPDENLKHITKRLSLLEIIRRML